jgi:fructose-1,6-bisphosphatase/inositol monophosphatase family enzyme
MTFSPTDIRRVGAILAAAARSEIMPRFRRLAAAQIRRKTSAIDLVTEADEAAEAVIGAELLAAFPGAVVIGEEGTHREPRLLERVADAELAFIVDPVDGTRNFASNLPLFGVMTAVTVRGEVVAGAIHDPICHDWAYAVRGGGAWLEEEDGARRELRVADPVPLGEMDGLIGTTYLAEPLRTTVNRNLSRFASTNSLRCAAHEYRMAASGFCHVLLYSKLMPWDHAAGSLIHREAGGYNAHFDGRPYLPTHFTGGLICAPDEASWRVARDALFER